MNNFLIIIITIFAILLILSILTLELSIIYYVYEFFKRSVVKVNLIPINIAIKRFYSILIKRLLSIIRKISTEAFNINAPPKSKNYISTSEAQNA